MASTSTEQEFFFQTMKHFPPVLNGQINVMEFLEASLVMVKIVDRLGTAFTPVKLDMQGNIDKIKRLYTFDENSCLLKLMLDEIANGKKMAAEGVLWLNRALLFFELSFKEIINHLQAKTIDINMKKVFSVAYEGSVKKYHNWITQQIFQFICKMSPNFPQVLKAFDAENNVNEFGSHLENFNITLHIVRCKIDDFFKENDIFDEHR